MQQTVAIPMCHTFIPPALTRTQPVCGWSVRWPDRSQTLLLHAQRGLCPDLPSRRHHSLLTQKGLAQYIVNMGDEFLAARIIIGH